MFLYIHELCLPFAAYCPVGHYSSTGLAPCAPCPLGTYQTNVYSTTCNACPDGKMTFAEGADSQEACNGKCVYIIR